MASSVRRARDTTSQTSVVRTTRTSTALRRIRSSPSERMPSSAPRVENTGPPEPPGPGNRSDSMMRVATRVTSPEIAPFGWRSGASRPMISSPTAVAGGGSPQPSGTTGTAAAVAGSMRTTARSRSGSVATTSPRTLRAGENCTSTLVAAPTAC